MKLNKSLFLTALTLAALTAGAWAQTTTESKPAAKKKHAAADPAPAQPAVTAADIQALKDALAAQQRQIQQLTQQLQQSQQNSQQAQAAAADAANQAAAAKAQASQQQDAVGALKSDVADLKTNFTSAVTTVQETQKTVNTALESPVAIRFKGVTITPGGFLAAEFVRRSRALAEDVATPLNSLTMPGAAQSNLSEFFGTGRTSRISMLTEGQLKNVKLSGYVEADFLSAGATSNSNSTNSYTLRQRQAFGQVAFNSGWTFTGGQQWTLLTESGHGLDNRAEAIPLTIDTSYSAGFTYARQYGLRLVKNINNKVWFGISLENSQATVTTHGNADNFLVGSAGNAKSYGSAVSTCATTTTIGATGTTATSTTTCTPVATYSFNPSPDIIAKVAFEPGFGHYEIFGLFDRFRDRIYPCVDITNPACPASLTASTDLATDVSRNGGGLGANARWTFANKHVVFGLHGFGGSGIGRYGTVGLPDASVYGNGSLHLVRNFQGLGTLEFHGSKLDIYTNAGAEYAARTASFDPYDGTGTVVGYGAPTFNNSGCYSETTPTTGTGFNPGGLSKCTADTRAVIEGTAGFWYRFYQGPKGRFQFGTQYSYVTRQTWSGIGAAGAGKPGAYPEGLDNMIFTSFRYYLP